MRLARLPIRAVAGRQTLLDDPPIYTIAGFLPERACERLVEASRPLLKPSAVAQMSEAELGAARIRGGGGRTSSSTFLHHRSVPSLLERAEQLLGMPRTHFEYPQISRYATGQQYTSHHDGFDLSTPAGLRLAGDGGQRLCTLLLYLSGCESGGETRFTRLGLSVRPQAGTALIFNPAFMCGTIDPMVQHSAEPAGGEKWVAQLWVRQNALHPASRVYESEEHARTATVLQSAPADVAGG